MTDDVLAKWWSETPDVDLQRSDYSVIIDALNERAELLECGDHIDQMEAEELRKLVTRISRQVDTEPPADLLRKRTPYQDGDRDD